jgi:hypothetical protein
MGARPYASLTSLTFRQKDSLMPHWVPRDEWLAVHWWLSYPPLGRRGSIGWMLEHYGHEAIIKELVKRLEGRWP